MAFELHGRHALITGAGAGIGAAIALQLAQAGCRLTLCGRSHDTLQAQAEALRAQVPDVAVLITVFAITFALAAPLLQSRFASSAAAAPRAPWAKASGGRTDGWETPKRR